MPALKYNVTMPSFQRLYDFNFNAMRALSATVGRHLMKKGNSQKAASSLMYPIPLHGNLNAGKNQVGRVEYFTTSFVL